MANQGYYQPWNGEYTFSSLGASTSAPDPHPKYHITTSGYAYNYWVSSKQIKAFGIQNYYPVQTAKRKLEIYSSDFDSFEVNVTRYRKLTPKMVQTWIPYFQTIIIKAPIHITHYKKLNDVQQWWNDFKANYEIIPVPKRGPILFQFSASFHVTDANLDKLLALRNSLPTDARIAVEFRHGDWFRSRDPRLNQLFSSPNWTMVIVHASGEPQTFGDMERGIHVHPLALTKAWVYHRLHGTDRFCFGSYSDNYLTEIIKFNQKFKFSEVYVAFNNTDSWDPVPRQDQLPSLPVGLYDPQYKSIQPSAINDGLKLKQLLN